MALDSLVRKRYNAGMNELTRAFVPADAVEIVVERVARISKRATKKGFPAPLLTFGRTEDRPVIGDSGKPIEGEYSKWVEVIIEGEPIKFSGWELLAVVSYLEDHYHNIMPIVDRVPGVEGDIGQVTEYDYCGHCKTVRRRNETFIVRKSVGDVDQYNQVGRNCLRDFLGHSPDGLIAMYEAYRTLSLDDDEIAGWGRSATKFYPPEHILAISARIVAKEGFYISKARAEEDDKTSTAELVKSFLSASAAVRKRLEQEYPDSPESERILSTTIEHIPGLDPANEYEGKIMSLAAASGIQWRHIGTLASGVIIGLRSIERAAKNKAKGDSAFLGQVGERITVPATITFKKEIASDFGSGFSYLIRMLSDGKNDMLWWASWSPTSHAMKEGDVFTVVGTVRGHEFDRVTQRPTTILTRCKIVVEAVG